MIDKKLLRNFDYILLFNVLILSVLGLFMIYSATQAVGDPYYYMIRQLVFIFAGLLILFLLIAVDYNSILNFSKIIYYGNLLLLSLVFVPYVGKTGGGAQRWIDFGFIDFQPSEFAKVAVILTLAKFLASKGSEIEDFIDMIPYFFHVVIPMGLIFLQPDLGTSIVFLAIYFGILYFNKVKIKLLSYFAGILAILAIPAYLFLLGDYQKARLTVFLNPENVDPLGAGFQILQSIVAVGSGGITGQGIFQGTQNQLRFIIEAHTDFIFSVIAEELGFIGASLTIILFINLIYRILRIAYTSKDLYGRLICGGVCTMILFQAFINMGMALSLMPLTGIPLPFVSYGGSSYIANMIAIGLVLNVGMRREKIMF